MKLTNPTDEELNVAFATEVAGWKSTPIHMPRKAGDVWWHDSGGNLTEGANFTRSADLVLPWLEKREEAGFHYLKGHWYVHLYAEDKSCANSPRLALAAVIVLLRAHGVEVEFK